MHNKMEAKFNQHLNMLLGNLPENASVLDHSPASLPEKRLPEKAVNETPRLIVALSGGVDSVVLLHLLANFKKHHPAYSVLAHNVNHGLSDNAEHWGLFCAELCQKLNVPFISSTVKIENKSRSSLEALARDARYQCFKDNMLKNDVILTGHHQDDQLETLLLALKRGSGSTGLQGIRSTQSFFNGHLVRPLLIFSRQALVDYAEFHQLQWIEDESNQDIDFDRNFIRHQISPLLIQRWPAMAQSASRTAQLCQEQQTLLNEVAQQDLGQCLVKRLSCQTLDIASLAAFSSVRRNNIIRFWLKSNGLQYPSSKQLTILWEEVALADVDKQPKLQLVSNTICRYQEALYIVPMQSIKTLEAPVTWLGESFLWLDEERLGVDFSKVDPAVAKQHHVQCCLRQHLDAKLTCLPEGRNKARSIKKLLHEYQVPPWLRDHVVFILVDNQLTEAVGLWRCQPNASNVSNIPVMDLSLYSR
ncbi:tRNA lysidine(34) synthetase TilS [uncultured Psychromonas sp.]|uniref:tRNA lysidine(34) synthetase TilS n=1 Tax=uncultured Psychromonas sp. TaxID=173974 RepID=UPI00262BF220|nr:tRNA lysidine(34) synthetase TilS [uncultured Psychromonas sp.]